MSALQGFFFLLGILGAYLFVGAGAYAIETLIRKRWPEDTNDPR